MRASDQGFAKKQPKSHRDPPGYTLVEMIIALGVAAVIVTALVAFFRNQAAHQGKKAARSAAMQMNRTLMEAVKRVHPRTASTDDYRSLFKTECVKAHSPQSHTRRLLEKAYSGFNKANFDITKGQCISSLNCPAGTMPQVKLQPGATDPDDPQREFPRLNSELKEQSWGSGICFHKAQNKVRVIVESAWLTDRSGAALSVVSDELMLTPADPEGG